MACLSKTLKLLAAGSLLFPSLLPSLLQGPGGSGLQARAAHEEDNCLETVLGRCESSLC